jgi:hypothetical protein
VTRSRNKRSEVLERACFERSMRCIEKSRFFWRLFSDVFAIKPRSLPGPSCRRLPVHRADYSHTMRGLNAVDSCSNSSGVMCTLLRGVLHAVLGNVSWRLSSGNYGTKRPRCISWMNDCTVSCVVLVRTWTTTLVKNEHVHINWIYRSAGYPMALLRHASLLSLLTFTREAWSIPQLRCSITTLFSRVIIVWIFLDLSYFFKANLTAGTSSSFSRISGSGPKGVIECGLI